MTKENYDKKIHLPFIKEDNSVGLETLEEKAKRLGVPVVWPKPRKPIDGNKTVAVCGECGREVKSVEYYACMNSNCIISDRELKMENDTGFFNEHRLY